MNPANFVPRSPLFSHKFAEGDHIKICVFSVNTPSEALGNYIGEAVAPHEGMEGVNSKLENANVIKLVMGQTKTAQHVH